MNLNGQCKALALVALTMSSALSFAQETPSRNNSDTNTVAIPMTTGPGTIQTRNTERDAEVGYFTNSAGAQGGTFRLNLRRIFGLGAHVSRDESYGVMFDPGVRLRIDATDNAFPRREIQVSGIGAWRVQERSFLGRERLNPAQRAAVDALKRAEQELTRANTQRREVESRLYAAREAMSGALPPFAGDHFSYTNQTSAIAKVIDAVAARPAFEANDIHEICDGVYTGYSGQQFRYTTEEQSRCRGVLSGQEVGELRRLATAAQQATHASEVAQQRREQAMAHAQEVLPDDEDYQLTDDERTAVNSTTEIMAPHASFVHRYNAFTGLQQTGALVEAVQLSGHAAVKINGRNIDFCGHLSPGGVILGSNNVGGSENPAMYRFYAEACAGINLGPVGHLRDEASFEGMYGGNSSLSVSNFAGIEHIAGTPVGAGYRYELDRTVDGTDRVRVNNTHMGVVQGSF